MNAVIDKDGTSASELQPAAVAGLCLVACCVIAARLNAHVPSPLSPPTVKASIGFGALACEYPPVSTPAVVLDSIDCRIIAQALRASQVIGGVSQSSLDIVRTIRIGSLLGP